MCISLLFTIVHKKKNLKVVLFKTGDVDSRQPVFLQYALYILTEIISMYWAYVSAY